MIQGNLSSPGKIKTFISEGYLNFFILSILLVILLPVAGCKTTGSELPGQNFSRTRHASQYQKIDGGGWVSIFLNLKEHKGPEISFEVHSVELQANEQKHSLLFDPLIINSKGIVSGQLFIARKSLPQNKYDTLSLRLRKAAIAGQSRKTGSADDDIVVEMKLPSLLNLTEGDSHSLFIEWDVFSSINDRGEFSPQMNASLQAIPFLSDLLYVACPEIDTVYAIRTDKNWVISSLGVVGGPTYMALDLAAQLLYILTPNKSAIQVVNIVTNKIADNIFMPLDFPPSYMTVNPDNSLAYVLDEQGKVLLSVDLSSGAIANRIALSFQPRYAVFLELQNTLAVSSFDTHAVYLFDPGNLIDSGMFSVGSVPDGLLPWNNFLLVAESGSNSVSMYDLYTNQQRARVNVGFSPRRLLIRRNQAYVTNFASNSISIMLPGQLNISGEIFLRGKPLELAVSESRRWIYAGDAERGGLHVIDSTLNRLSGFIDLQALPAGLAVID